MSTDGDKHLSKHVAATLLTAVALGVVGFYGFRRGRLLANDTDAQPVRRFRLFVLEMATSPTCNTPMIRIESLSAATGCTILGKAEFLNPGGSVKDRVALTMVGDALDSGALEPGGLVTEGTAGSTGVALAMVCAARGLRCQIFMPDDAAEEKSSEIRAFGAEVTLVRPVSISHPEHMVNAARRAARAGNGFFADQFDNKSNFKAHVRTGQEIVRQCGGGVDAFVCGAGTGGTIAGVSAALKLSNPRTKVFLSDPPGSSLSLKVKRGVMYTRHESEGRRVKHPFDTVTEGVGLNRLTKNFARAQIDDAFDCSDQEAVDMGQFLLQQDGLWVGSSSCVNCVGAVKAARRLGPGHTIVTIVCDGGRRHASKFYNPAFLQKHGLQVRQPAHDLSWIANEGRARR